MGKKKTTEEFKKEVYDLVGDDYIVLEEYKTNSTKIFMKHNCDKCNNYEFPMRPKDFLKGQRCPKCSGRMKKTTEEFKKEVYDLVGDEYTVLGEYINDDTKILIRHNCEECNNYEFPMRPSGFLRNGNRCPYCAGCIVKTTEEFKKEIYDLVGDEYIVLGEYINNKTELLMRHNCEDCNNYEFPMRPCNFLFLNNRCPYCADTTKTTEEFKKEIYDLVGDEYTVLGEYINNKTELLMRHNCELCLENEFLIKPKNFLKGQRCPECALIKNESYGSKEITKILNKNNINFEKEYKFEDCKNKKRLPFDFYLPENNLIIEYDGKQHFKKCWKNQELVEKQQMRDIIKNNYCINKKIILVRIPYTVKTKEISNIIEELLKENYDLEKCLIIKDGNYLNNLSIYDFINKEE